MENRPLTEKNAIGRCSICGKLNFNMESIQSAKRLLKQMQDKRYNELIAFVHSIRMSQDNRESIIKVVAHIINMRDTCFQIDDGDEVSR